MNPVPDVGPDEKLIGLLRAAHQLDLREAPRRHSQSTRDCPPLPRLVVTRRQDWSDDEQRHITGCAYCQKILVMAERAASDPSATGGNFMSESRRNSAQADEPTPVQGDTSVQSQSTGFTALARAGRIGDLEDRLRPWLPFFLRRAGLADDLDEALARQFLASIRTRFKEVQQRRFRELLPEWLRDFSIQHNLVHRLRSDRLAPSGAELEADAVERVLRRLGENEKEWAKAFRESALRSGIPSVRGLLEFGAAASAPAATLASYRHDLFREARAAHREGVELFECAVSV